MLEVLGVGGGVKLQLSAVDQGADTPEREDGALQDSRCPGVGQTARLRHGAKTTDLQITRNTTNKGSVEPTPAAPL